MKKNYTACIWYLDQCAATYGYAMPIHPLVSCYCGLHVYVFHI